MTNNKPKDSPIGQQNLLRMYENGGESKPSRLKVGNIRMIKRKKTVGEITFRICRKEMIIDELFVKPQFRKRGFGTHLLRLAEKIAAETGLKRIFLKPSSIDTVEINALKKWYCQRGYFHCCRGFMQKFTDSSTYHN